MVVHLKQVLYTLPHYAVLQLSDGALESFFYIAINFLRIHEILILVNIALRIGLASNIQ